MPVVQRDNPTEPYADPAEFPQRICGRPVSGIDTNASRFERGPHCPGRKPPFWAVKRLARPYKIATQNRFTMENAKAD
jgi:hypothetical protein